MPPMSEQQEPEGWGGPSESDWAGLTHRVGTLEQMARVAEVGYAHMTEQIAEITVSQRRADLQRTEQTRRLDAITTELADNSKVTREILQATQDLRDVVITAKTGGKFAKWLAPTLIATAAALGVLKGWWLASIDWLGK